jgi:hypothetical protein
VKVAGEAEDSEEGRAGAVVVKEEAGEVTAVPLKARAKHKVFSRLAASKPPLSTSLSITFLPKICHPSGACSRPPPPLLGFLSQVLNRISLFKISNTRLVTKTASWRQFHVCV